MNEKKINKFTPETKIKTNHVNNIILLNPEGEFAGIFRPPFDVSRLSLTYQSVTSN